MSYITKKVSSRAILAKVYRTIRPKDSDWLASAIEDIGWAIQGIGYHIGFEQKATPDNTPFCVVDHRIKVPCDCERVLFVEQYTSAFTPMNAMDAEGYNIESTDNSNCRKTSRLPKGTDIRLKSLDRTTGSTTIVTPINNYYDVQGDFIITGFPTCELKVHYMAFPTDEEGLPMVIDDFDYKTSVFWYVIAQMILSGYKIPDLNFLQANALFEKHMAIASNNCKMPSIDGMEAFKNMWLRYSGQEKFHRNFGINFENAEYIDF